MWQKEEFHSYTTIQSICAFIKCTNKNAAAKCCNLCFQPFSATKLPKAPPTNP